MAEKERIIEPIFNLPVIQPESREGWFMRTFSEDHPIHYGGIETDDSFRPVDETGTVLIENAWVAGTLLAHHNAIREKSREGIELVTGYLAARRALGKMKEQFSRSSSRHNRSRNNLRTKFHKHESLGFWGKFELFQTSIFV